MTFHWPYSFWFLLVPIFLAIFERRGRPGRSEGGRPKIIRAEAGPHFLSLTSVAHGESTARVRWRLLVGLAFAVVALARPQWGRIEEPVFDQAREILIAVDLSRSMLADDVKPTRLDRAKLLITSLLERLAGERVGLVVFSGTAFLQSPLSPDYEILREFLPALGPDYLPEGGTDYRSLLETCISAFSSTGTADRYLIILSDGEAQTDDWKPLVSGLKEKGIRVLGLGIGTTAGAMLPDGKGGLIKDERGAVVLSKLESGTLQELAQATSGVYTDASSWVDLPELIKSTVDTGKKGAFREQNRVRLGERFQWALAPALLFLALSFWREVPVRPRIRNVKLTGPQVRPGAGLTAAATTSVVAVLILSGAFLTSAMGAPVAPTEDTAAQPLAKLVGQFAARDRLAARDYAELSRTTVTYGERQASAQGKVSEGAIRDGLSAVDAGEAMDPKAADWPAIRHDLEKFLENKDQKQQQKQQSPPKDDPSKDKKDKPEEKKENPSDKPDDSKSDSPKPSPDQDKKSDQKDKDPKSDDKKKDEPKDGSKSQSAFGDMKDSQGDKNPPEPKPEEFQKVGGAPEKKSEAPPKDPALAIPLQKLDQLRDQDSPARLYQLMQDQQPTPAKKGKDW